MMLELMAASGAGLAHLYAYLKESRVVTEEGKRFLGDEEVLAWDGAVERISAMYPKSLRKEMAAKVLGMSKKGTSFRRIYGYILTGLDPGDNTLLTPEDRGRWAAAMEEFDRVKAVHYFVDPAFD